MNFNDLLKKLFGNKSQRDLKEIQPWVDKVKAVYPAIEKLSNDELRARTQAIMQGLQDSVAADRKKIDELKAGVESLEVEKREAVWNEIDKIKKNVLETLEKGLMDALPEVFAIVKNTGYRFANNETVVVTATDMDRELAATKDFVTIDGDKAIYSTTWSAGGNPVHWDMVHYDVQLFGGVVLHKGKIAEMATGEGKTLVATLPVFLNALTHNGVHVVTVNDYLAKRDCEWMGPLYQFHGLTVDCIDRYQPNSDQRRRAYNCDITFGTNNEFGFDYLRDNMATRPEDLVQREHNFAIVDEVDSVLIDDARTPLIISGPVQRTSEYSDEELYQQYRPRVERVVAAQKKLFNELLTEAKKKVNSPDKETKDEGATQLYRAYRAWPKSSALIKFLSEPGVKQELLRAEAYYLQDNRKEMPVALEPLYFAIEEKNKQVDLTDKGIALLSNDLEDQSFFVLPDVGSEIAAIDSENISKEEKLQKKDELMSNYVTKAERVHAVDQLLKAYTMFDKDVDYIVSEDGKVKIVDEQTGRIMEGRRWSDGLHQAVEAKEHVRVEATTQTYATITLQNYFRMYHKLSGMTGTAETEAGEFWDIYKLDVVEIPTNRPVLRKDLDDRVYKTNREKYAAVIDEIVEMRNSGRPVLVGTTSVEFSELISKMLNMRKIPHQVLNAKLHKKEADIVAEAGRSTKGMVEITEEDGSKHFEERMLGAVTIATNMAGRGTDIKLTKEVKEAGGLAIIGTERHESRRVDRQLRGRAGRQGDPGSSVFYVSLEDKLMRLFASERIASLMDRLGFKEGDRIENPMISKSIERAQKKVEENNFGIRKHLLEYDDVMNKQRTVIYEKRRHALMGERIGMDITNVIWDRVVNIIETNDYAGCREDFLKVLAMECPFSEEDFENVRHDELEERAFQSAMATFKRKTDRIESVAWPIIKEVEENQGAIYERIMVPITDGKRVYNIPCNLKEAYRTEGRDVVKQFERVIMLHIIDDCWKENLRQLDELRHSVQNASYEQKDPLLIFKLESAKLFDSMVNDMNNRIASILTRGQIPEMQQQQEVREAAPEERTQRQQYTEQKAELNDPAQQAAANHDTRKNIEENHTPLVKDKLPGRNDPCPCGSGKKFKNCHGKGLE